jgi:hypothetical protein
MSNAKHLTLWFFRAEYCRKTSYTSSSSSSQQRDSFTQIQSNNSCLRPQLPPTPTSASISVDTESTEVLLAACKVRLFVSFPFLIFICTMFVYFSRRVSGGWHPPSASSMVEVTSFPILNDWRMTSFYECSPFCPPHTWLSAVVFADDGMSWPGILNFGPLFIYRVKIYPLIEHLRLVFLYDILTQVVMCGLPYKSKLKLRPNSQRHCFCPFYLLCKNIFWNPVSLKYSSGIFEYVFLRQRSLFYTCCNFLLLHFARFL